MSDEISVTGAGSIEKLVEDRQLEIAAFEENENGVYPSITFTQEDVESAFCSDNTDGLTFEYEDGGFFDSNSRTINMEHTDELVVLFGEENGR